ncbi:MAG: methyltransferase domain-containing protein [Verrucomicrobia bacterium]|nr:methyltransferase domain-containing protein [Verrucomicrobiota bacterium]
MIVPASPIGETEVADHYDRLNEFYNDVWGLHRHHGYWESGSETASEAVALMARKILNAAQLAPGSKVVDVGCGTGGIAWYFAREAEVEVMAYTLSQEEKATAEDGGMNVRGGSASFVCSDWLENDLPDEWADAVVLIESFSHMVDRGAVLAEIERVLKPGGRLVLTDWVVSEHPSPWQVKGLLEPICRGGKLTGLSSIKENGEMLKEASLRVLECNDITDNVSKTWQKITVRLVGKMLGDSHYRKFMWQSLLKDRDLFFAIPRVMLAYALTCLRYEWLVAEKGSCTRAGIEANVRP